MFEGHGLSTGDSLIVTENVQVDAPQLLDAMHVTVVVPVLNEDPDAGEQTIDAAGVPVEVGVEYVAM